jgi:hypothetical protein
VSTNKLVDTSILKQSITIKVPQRDAYGAFTDARDTQVGLVAQADGGTLFLDEVDSLTQICAVAFSPGMAAIGRSAARRPRRR